MYLPYACQGRTHSFLKLSNGLSLLLISDPAEEVAAASLSVAAGHHADPPDVPGLAHLCEHMVCVSSKKYPKTDLYKHLVSQMGGSWNAVTVSEKTSFFFSVPLTGRNDQQLATLLDVFASYFTHPLFDSTYFHHEVLAVDDEHAKNISLPSRQSFHGLKLLASKSHPFSRFSTGNYDSLAANNNNNSNNNSKQTSRKLLRNFFDTHYSPSNMALVIKGPQSLNQLHHLAVPIFSSLGRPKSTSFSTTRLDLSRLDLCPSVWIPQYQGQEVFPRETLGRYIAIESTSAKLYRLFFPYTPRDHKQESIWESFWSHILGSETRGSLSSVLMQENLITELMARATPICSNTRTLELQFQLTHSGARNTDRILQLVFAYFSSLLTGKVRKLAKCFSQFEGIEMYNFYNAERESDPQLEVRAYSQKLLDPQLGNWFFKSQPCYDTSDPHYAGSYYETPRFWIDRASDFRDFVNRCCRIDNMLACYLGPLSVPWIASSEDHQLLLQKDPYFKFRYLLGRYPSSLPALATPVSSFSIPPPNPFVPPDVETPLHLLTQLSAQDQFSVKSISSDSYPDLFRLSDGYQIWVKKEYDPVFREKMFVSIELICDIDSTVHHVICFELLCELARQRLREPLYPAVLIGYTYELLPSLKGDAGMTIAVSGPSPSITNVLVTIVSELNWLATKFDAVTNNDWRAARVAVHSKYTASAAMPSHMLVSLGLLASMEEKTWLLDDRIDALEEVDFVTVSETVKGLFDRCFMSCLIHGDVGDPALVADHLLSSLDTLVGTFGPELRTPSTVRLPPGANYTVHSTCKDPTNAISYFLQTALRNDPKSSALTRFLLFVLAVPLAQLLRINYQLGYVVLVGHRVFRKVEGIHVTIMNGQMSPTLIERKVEEAIMEWYERMVASLDGKKFATLCAKFIRVYKSSKLPSAGGPASLILQGSPDTGQLGKQHSGYWDQIVNRSFKFSHSLLGEDSIDTEYIAKSTYQEFLAFVAQHVIPTSNVRIKLSAMLTSEVEQDKIDAMLRPFMLFTFLSSAGLPIKLEALTEIMKQAGSSKLKLCKSLYLYYKSQGRSGRLVTAGLARMSVALFPKSASETAFKTASSARMIDADRLPLWQTDMGYL